MLCMQACMQCHDSQAPRLCTQVSQREQGQPAYLRPRRHLHHPLRAAAADAGRFLQ